VLEAKPGRRLDPTARRSESPDHKECVCLFGEAQGPAYQQKLLSILRDRRGRHAGLSMTKVLPPDPGTGRFGRLLPQTPLTEKVRAFAASMLESRGLVLAEAPHGN